jgi:hypothetical protein
MSIPRALAAWLLLLALAIGNGTLRQLAYADELGDGAAHQLSTLILLGVFAAAILSLTRWWVLASCGQAWRTGALWAALTVAFELGLGRAGGRSWELLLSDWAFWHGRLWPLVPLFLLVAPALVYARDGARRRKAALRVTPAASA